MNLPSLDVHLVTAARFTRPLAAAAAAAGGRRVESPHRPARKVVVTCRNPPTAVLAILRTPFVRHIIRTRVPG